MQSYLFILCIGGAPPGKGVEGVELAIILA